MDGANGYGKLKILPTPIMGNLVRTMLESGVKLGVSSRGSGNVSEDGNNTVFDFEIITVDVVAQPGVHGAYFHTNIRTLNERPEGTRLTN